jgi:hypothetical protein
MLNFETDEVEDDEGDALQTTDMGTSASRSAGRIFTLDVKATSKGENAAAAAEQAPVPLEEDVSEDSKQISLLAARLAKMPANFSFGRSQISRR